MHTTAPSESQQQSVLKRILAERFAPRQARIDLARRRQHALFAGKRPDAWPVKIVDPPTEPEDDLYPAATDDEFFTLLCRWLRISDGWLNSESDIVPFILAQFGTGVNLACLGMEPTQSDGLYGPPHPLDKQEALALTEADIRPRGTFQKALDFMAYAKGMVQDQVPICKPDCQSPFSLACMIMGPDFFTLPFESPEQTAQMLELATTLYTRSTSWCKTVDDEPATATEGGGLGISSSSFGALLSVDHAVMFSPQMVEDYVIPTCQDAAAAFGGARIHYCGWRESLTAELCRLPETRVMNMGVVAKEEIPYDTAMKLCIETDTVYHGNMPVLPTDTAKGYIDRLHDWATSGCLLPVIPFSQLKQKPDCPWRNGAELADDWYNR